MKHYIDCEFDGLGGQLISISLVSETGRSLYVIMDYRSVLDPWVRENVIPQQFSVPLDQITFVTFGATPAILAEQLEAYFKSDTYPHIIADWPDDIKYFCEAIITGPGTMINVPGFKFSVKCVDAYPSALKNAVRHNAYWDAMALRHLFVDPQVVDTQLSLKDM